MAWHKKAAHWAEIGDLPWQNGGFHRFFIAFYDLIRAFFGILWGYHWILFYYS